MCDYLFATVTLFAMCDCLQSEMCDYLFATVTLFAMCDYLFAVGNV